MLDYLVLRAELKRRLMGTSLLLVFVCAWASFKNLPVVQTELTVFVFFDHLFDDLMQLTWIITGFVMLTTARPMGEWSAMVLITSLAGLICAALASLAHGTGPAMPPMTAGIFLISVLAGMILHAWNLKDREAVAN